ncbi:MAG: UDP-glucose 4-epimerase GalE [Planctomycetaceae bacterium]|nr:UDP-glucose 4-epimerase GalE [Planctomycetaceae bacterium]
MAILVPGGAGYIGSHTVYALIDQGEDVVVVDNMQTGHRAAVHPGARLWEGDIRHEAFLDELFVKEKIDAVIHFAANSLVGESVQKPLDYYDNNLYGTMVLLRCMAKHDVDKIVFSSTAATYGNPDSVPILESAPTRPANPYGETKLAMEAMMKWVSAASRLRYVSLRYFNACGALEGGAIGEDHRNETHLIPIVLQVANGTRPEVTIFGNDYNTPDGTCVRDYIHVMDLAQAHLLALKHLRNGGKNEIINLGNGVGFSVKEVVDTCRSVTGKDIRAVTGPRRPGDPDQLVASSLRAQEVLGFSAGMPRLDDIVASAWEWHRSHPRGFDS